jgi:hypothetical protein
MQKVEGSFKGKADIEEERNGVQKNEEMKKERLEN